MADNFLFSGEPLPLAPRVGGWADSAKGRANELELENFHRKLLDYIRRLGAKLSNPTFPPSGGGGGTMPVFAAGISSEYTLPQNTFQTIDWNAFYRMDTASFSHSTTTNPDEITFLQDGLYLFLVDIGHNEGSADDGVADFRIVETTLGVVDYGETNGSGLAGAHGVITSEHIVSFQVPVNAAAGSTWTIEAKRDANAWRADPENTRITIIHFGVVGTTTYPPAGAGCTGPFDCFIT